MVGPARPAGGLGLPQVQLDAARTCPAALPEQSTISKRTRRDDFEPFLLALGRRLNGRPARTLIKRFGGGGYVLADAN